jgi:hypothetical protein
MASFTFRRAFRCALPSIAVLAVTIGPAVAGTDVFGSGTGGLGSHGTSVSASSYDKSGWGITTMKGYVPPAPEPYTPTQLGNPSYGANNTSSFTPGGNGYGSNVLRGGLEGDSFGGALEPLDQ